MKSNESRMKSIRMSIFRRGNTDSYNNPHAEPIDDPFADQPDHDPFDDPQPTELFLMKHQSALPDYASDCKFEWNDINVHVGDESDGLQILFNSNGCIQSGQLLAVMGGSGAGKSTLLNALSGRTNLNEQTVNGYLAINGRKFKCSEQKIIRSLCTFVPQTDILCPTQTVEEALLFYATLKLPHLSSEKQKKRINYLIHVLHLDKCRNNIIGSEAKRGISGGEKRRVSIASEILNDADIIFLDEPTSGLDAYTAARTIKTLKQFCFVSNKIIISTIHQPSVEVFYLFDSLLLLGDGYGCFNSSIKEIDIFFKEALRPKTNPADVIVFEVQRKPNEYSDEWTNSALNPYGNQDQRTAEWSKYVPFGAIEAIPHASKALQYRLLLVRECKALIRDKRISIIRIAQVIFFAFVCGFLYQDIDDSFSRKGQCFIMLAVIPILLGMVSLLTVFPQQKLLFNREYSSKTYDITTWALSHIIIEIPRELIHMLLFTTIIYYMIGLDSRFDQFFVTLFLTTFAGGSIGLFFGTITRTTVEAAQTVPAGFIPLLIFSDALFSLDDFPPSILWIADIDPLYYIVRCFYMIEFSGVEYDSKLTSLQQTMCDSCQDLETTCQQLQSNYTALATTCSLGVPDPFATTATPETTTITTAETIAESSFDEVCSATRTGEWFFSYKSMESDSLMGYWISITVICVVLRVISILILSVINNNGCSWMCNQIAYIIGCRFCVKKRKLQEQETQMSLHVEYYAGSEREILEMNTNINTIVEEVDSMDEDVKEVDQMIMNAELNLQKGISKYKKRDESVMDQEVKLSLDKPSKYRSRSRALTTVKRKVVEALFDYPGGYRQYELTFRAGTRLVITMEGTKGWVWGHYSFNPSIEGWFPKKWVQDVEQDNSMDMDSPNPNETHIVDL